MTADRIELYASPNGDRWFLALSATTPRPVVLHVPNQPSGGLPTQIELGSFLAGSGPEHQELLRLIGTLIEGASFEDAPAGPSHWSPV
ncbi:hypothetical protein MOX02_60180 [Methylobacterium oxalidis]|uniref:Uncharacterized protein n=1 Tax=Methylobacterium oxalidis TaxID=944322 RepID=A0A512JDE9_9HYPH|nr:hypothetical protein MOX02_60180 [Methylobacterium oxalidis]GLS64517.1 hypothetical protein GCM10007888_28980 [Methylobacterium oxalidis]